MLTCSSFSRQFLPSFAHECSFKPQHIHHLYHVSTYRMATWATTILHAPYHFFIHEPTKSLPSVYLRKFRLRNFRYTNDIASQLSQVTAQSSHSSVKSQLSQVTAQSSHSSVTSQLSHVTAQSSHSSVK